MLVFDKAYNYYLQFAKWTESKIYFVTRQKTNALYQIIETVMEKELQNWSVGVNKEEIIEVTYKENKEEKQLKLRRIYYFPDICHF